MVNIPLDSKRMIQIQVPIDFKFSEIPKTIVRIAAYLKCICASTCTEDKK